MTGRRRSLFELVAIADKPAREELIRRVFARVAPILEAQELPLPIPRREDLSACRIRPLKA